MENFNNMLYILPLFLQLAAKRQFMKPRICASFRFSTVFGPAIVENSGEKGETVIFNLDFTKRNCCLVIFPFCRQSLRRHKRHRPAVTGNSTAATCRVCTAFTKAPALCAITERRCLSNAPAQPPQNPRSTAITQGPGVLA